MRLMREASENTKQIDNNGKRMCTHNFAQWEYSALKSNSSWEKEYLKDSL